ncbi:MAG: FG-GAP-like repeat-containing protein [Vicinamibacterales bacterium]
MWRLSSVVVAGVMLAALYGYQPDTARREAAYRANNIGVALLEQFDYEGATRSFREALEQHPSLDIARLNLAIALFYAGKTTEASAAAREATARLANLPQAHYVAGLIYRAEDNLEAAQPAFERVLKIDAGDAGANVNLGQIGLQQRQYEKALDYFRQAMAAEPYNVTAAYSAALALTRSGKADEGRKAMQHFEALRDSAYGVTYAQSYLAQGKYAEAIASTGAEPELVNPATPDVRFLDATTTMTQGPGGRLARRSEQRGGGEVGRSGGREVGSAGAVVLFDADGDGDLDLIEVGQSGLQFLRNEKGIFREVTEAAGLAKTGPAAGAISGDYDNDGRTDLFLVRADGYRLFHQTSTGTFEDVSEKSGIGSARPAKPDAAPSAAAFADVDHDGDLDLVVTGSPTRLLRNNGNGTFADVAVQAGLSAPLSAVALAATDYDNRRDIDLVVVPRDGAPVLYRNMRDGSFRDAASDSGLPSDGSYSALAIGDVNKDGFSDFLFGRSGQPSVLSLSDGQTKFRNTPAPAETAGTIAAQFVDYDSDGLLDLLTLSDASAHLFRNIGAGKWADVTTAARLPSSAATKSAQTRFESLALGDVDNDGDTDALVRLADGDVRIWRNEGGNRNASLRVRLAARVSNRNGIGARVEIRAGSLRQQFESASSTPAVAPADIVFGLGSRRTADVVRVLWPSGILQAETALPPEERTATITELDRKPSSCPYLFTWNGTRFEFVTDFMGGGEMGAWLAPGVWNHPDPDEYVRLASHQLRARDGFYELRVTNELEEALFVDRLQLVAVDHPEDVDVFPNEGLRSPPRPPFALTMTRGARPPAKAVDEHGHDVLPQIAAVDRRYPDDFRLRSIRGYAEPHFVELDPGVSSDRLVLLMTGWTDYAFSNDNVAASQLGETMAPPSVQVQDGDGRWKMVIPEIGFPVGRPQTIVVDLAGKWLSASRQVRILTNMRIYWDQILVASGAEAATRVSRLDPVSADLTWRGFSAEVTPDGREPFGYDHSRVSSAAPWKIMVGRYTREGDVRPLLQDVDDLYVISRPGDELSVRFAERALPRLPSGWTRTFLVYSYGWSKEMNPRSASPDTIGPLPFSGMSGYPYGQNEHYPRSTKHREYMERYNTRIVSRAVPAIDASLR